MKYGVILWGFLALPSMRYYLELNLTTHMLVQIPLLVTSGWLVGRKLTSSYFEKINRNGIPGLLVGLFTLLFWMIPRWLDASLTNPFWEAVKFITIPGLVGVPLGASWFLLKPIARGFVWANGISMLLILGWLYLEAPMRVCNNYLVNQQEYFAYNTFGIAIAIAVYWVSVAFYGDWKNAGKR